MSSQSTQKPKKKKTKVNPEHRIWDLIVRVPKETSDVRKDLEDLGISRDKIIRYKSDNRSFVAPGDALILRTYFKKWPDLGVDSVDDLYQNKTADEKARSLNLSR